MPAIPMLLASSSISPEHGDIRHAIDTHFAGVHLHILSRHFAVEFHFAASG